MIDLEKVNAHSIDSEEVAEKMNTSIENGLIGNDVQRRIEEYGRNELVKEKGKTAWQIFIGQFKDFLIYLLMFALAISILIGIYESTDPEVIWPPAYTDAIVIAAILIVNAILGFYQEYQAERSLESLKKLAPHYAKVRRDGRVIEIGVEEVVPGDIALFEEGDKFPADVRIYREFSLYVDEAILTGESKPVKKQLNPVDEKMILAETSRREFKSRNLLIRI